MLFSCLYLSILPKSVTLEFKVVDGVSLPSSRGHASISVFASHVATYSTETMFQVNFITAYNLIMAPDFIYGTDGFYEITQNKTNIVIT